MARRLVQTLAVLLSISWLAGCALIAPLGTTPGVLDHQYALDRQHNVDRLSAELFRDVEQIQTRANTLYAAGQIDEAAHERVQQAFQAFNTAATQHLAIIKDLQQGAFTREDALKSLLVLVQTTMTRTMSQVTPRAGLELSDSLAALRYTVEELASVA